MSILRAPFVVATTLGLHIATTAPEVAQAEERLKSTPTEYAIVATATIAKVQT